VNAGGIEVLRIGQDAAVRELKVGDRTIGTEDWLRHGWA
jgi:hypothetical protein